MSGKITTYLREFVFPISIILTIIGGISLIIGLVGYLSPKTFIDVFNIAEKDNGWYFYIIIIGFIILMTGVYYLYMYLKNKKFILEEIQTNKRSELQKRHLELKNTVKHMPSKYQKMLKDKEKELKLK